MLLGGFWHRRSRIRHKKTPSVYRGVRTPPYISSSGIFLQNSSKFVQIYYAGVFGIADYDSDVKKPLRCTWGSVHPHIPRIWNFCTKFVEICSQFFTWGFLALLITNPTSKNPLGVPGDPYTLLYTSSSGIFSQNSSKFVQI